MADSLRADLDATVRIWREESEPYPDESAEDAARRGGFGYCAGELAQILARYPEPQPAPELAGEVERLRSQILVIRELAEGASAANLSTTPRGKFAAAILSQLDPQ